MDSLPDEEVELADCQIWRNQVFLLVQISNSCLWGFLYYHLYRQKLSQTTELYHGQNEPHSYTNAWNWPVWLCINWRGYLLSVNMKEWEEKSCILFYDVISTCLVNQKELQGGQPIPVFITFRFLPHKESMSRQTLAMPHPLALASNKNKSCKCPVQHGWWILRCWKKFWSVRSLRFFTITKAQHWILSTCSYIYWSLAPGLLNFMLLLQSEKSSI